MTDKQTRIKPEATESTPGASTSVEHTAPEDHYTSGGQQKEQKEVLKKSVKDEQAQPMPDQSAGVHSTGSHTGTSGGADKARKK